MCVRAWGWVPPHVGAVEEVSDGEQRRQDSPEGLIGGKLLHAELQVKQRFGYLLQGRHSHRLSIIVRLLYCNQIQFFCNLAELNSGDFQV